MDFTLTEEQKGIKALIRDFIKKEIDAKRMMEIAYKMMKPDITLDEVRAIYPWDIIDKMDAVGLRQLCSPEKYGGGGITKGHWLTRTIAMEEWGYSDPGLMYTNAMHWRYTSDIAVCASEEQQDHFFPSFMKDKRMLLAVAVSEPQGMCDISQQFDKPEGTLKVTATRDGNDWIINGDKMFCTGGPTCNRLIAMVRTQKKGPLSESASQFWFPADIPGLEIRINHAINPDLFGDAQLHFDNVRVPAKNMLGELNKAGSVRSQRVVSKMLLWAGLLGMSQKVYEHMRDYAKERVAGGKPIIQHSSVATLVAKAAASVEATRLLLYKTSWDYDQFELATNSGSVPPAMGLLCAWYVKDLCYKMCEIAEEVYGGVGTHFGMPLWFYMPFIHAASHAGLTPGFNLIRAAKYL